MLHLTRQSYLQAESLDRIKKALRYNTRSDDGPFDQGDRVYFKRQRNSVWRGPATLIGQEGPTVVVKQGGYVSRIHCTQLRKVARTVEELKIYKQSPTTASPKQLSQNNDCIDHSIFEERTCETEDVDQEEKGTPDDDAPADHQKNEVSSTKQGCEPDDQQVESSKHIVFPSRNAMIRFSTPGDDRTYEARVIGRAGKSKGIHKHWANIEYTEPECLLGTRGAIDLQDGVSHWETVTALIATVQEEDFENAKTKELQSWEQFNVYTKVPLENQQFITTRWVCSEKEGTKKTRLVARGFEDPEYDIVLKVSPTCSKESFRAVLALFASRPHWNSGCIDVKTAFLQGSEIKRDVYLLPPIEARQPNTLWKLQKAVYGLTDAPRQWFNRVCDELLATGCVKSKYDNCVFYRRENSVCKDVLTVHVDDFWWAGDSLFEQTVVNYLNCTFVIGKITSVPCKYLGVDISRQGNGACSIDQTTYAAALNEISIDLQRKSEKSSKLTRGEEKTSSMHWTITVADSAFTPRSGFSN